MDPKRKARVDLPNFPEDLFRTWLDERIEHMGWHPGSADWDALFLDRPLKFWQSVAWHRLKFTISLPDLSAFSRGLILKQPPSTLGRFEPNDRARIQEQVAYISANGTFRDPPLLLLEGSKFLVLDGHHRLSGMFITNVIGPHEYWVACV